MGAAPAQASMPEWPFIRFTICVSFFLSFFNSLFVANYSSSSLPNPTSNLCWILINALTLPTLPLCHATNTSALLLGLRPANLFTLWKHKQIDKLHRGADNSSFHLHSRLSSVTGILSCFLSCRQMDKQKPWPTPPPSYRHKDASQGLDLWPASARSHRLPSCRMATAHSKSKRLKNTSKSRYGQKTLQIQLTFTCSESIHLSILV